MQLVGATPGASLAPWAIPAVRHRHTRGLKHTPFIILFPDEPLNLEESDALCFGDVPELQA